MRDALRRLTADSVIYGLGQVLGRAVQLLLVPVLTRLLAPQVFGLAELVTGYMQTAVLVLVFGMDAALARFFYEQPDRATRVRMVSSSLAFRLLASSLASAVFIAFSGPIAVGLLGGGGRELVGIGAVTLPFTLIVMFSNDVLRVTFQPVKYIALNLVQTALVTTLSIVFVAHFHLGAAGVLWGRLAGDGVSAIAGLVLIRHSLAPRFSRKLLRTMLSYGGPTVPGALGFAALSAMDRFVLQRTRSLEEVAVYAVALRFFAVMTFAASAFQLAYGPFAYARAHDADAPRLFARVFTAFVALASLGALVLSAFAPEALAVLVPASYRGAALPALGLAFAAVGLGAYTVASVGIGLALRTPLLSLCAWSGAVAAGVAHALWTPRYGPPGAAFATMTGYVVIALVTYAVAQRVRPMPYRGGRALGLYALAFGLALAAHAAAPLGAAGVAARAGIILLYVGVCAAVWYRDRNPGTRSARTVGAENAN